MIDYEKLYLKAMNRIAELENMDREECCEAFKAKQAARIAELEALQEWHKAKCASCGFAVVWKSGKEITCRKRSWGYDSTQQLCWGYLDIDSDACPEYVMRELPPMPERDGA